MPTVLDPLTDQAVKALLVQQAQKWAADTNSSNAAMYRRYLNDYRLNFPLWQALGQPIPDRPVPEFQWIVTVDGNGYPVRSQTTDLCTPQQPDVVVVLPEADPVGELYGDGNLSHYRVKPGSTQVIGEAVTNSRGTFIRLDVPYSIEMISIFLKVDSVAHPVETA